MARSSNGGFGMGFWNEARGSRRGTGVRCLTTRYCELGESSLPSSERWNKLPWAPRTQRTSSSRAVLAWLERGTHATSDGPISPQLWRRLFLAWVDDTVFATLVFSSPSPGLAWDVMSMWDRAPFVPCWQVCSRQGWILRLAHVGRSSSTPEFG